MKIECAYDELVDVEKLVPHPLNPNKHGEKQIKMLGKILEFQGWRSPITVSNRSGYIVAGHGRLEAAKMNGYDSVPVDKQDFENEAAEYAHIIADNKIASLAEHDDALMIETIKDLELEEMDFELLGLDDFEFKIEEIKDIDGADSECSRSLVDKFGIPPFSIIDTRQGYWQRRKAQWIARGIRSELGREEQINVNAEVKEGSKTGMKRIAPATSIFDPALAEICISWFSPDGGIVLDPFAGGSVRGIVASFLNRQYVGNDLRAEQVSENRAQANIICVDNHHPPVWSCGDSLDIKELCEGVEADMVFSCPPYADLEVYSDLPQDISTMGYDDFYKAYSEIINRSCSMLKDDSFAVFVVGEVRGKDGNYLNFVSDTVKCFNDAGLSFYNDIVLINQSGTAAMRADKLINSSRKVVKTHQNVLVFVKGDAKKAAKNCGEIFISNLPEQDQ